MDSESPELIEHKMHETRQSLTDKVAALESQITDKLETATTNVQDTVETVKSAVADTVNCVSGKFKESLENVQDSVAGVKASLDVRDPIRERPWAAMAAAALSGVVVGLMSAPARKRSEQGGDSQTASGRTYAAATGPSGSARPGLFDGVLNRLRDEITVLGESAIATLGSTLKNSVNDGIKDMVTTVFAAKSAQPRETDEQLRQQREHAHSNGIAKGFAG
jgi:ElaB/YqjD/DUF883 family membrane-anchored ribosome-binding protein